MPKHRFPHAVMYTGKTIAIVNATGPREALALASAPNETPLTFDTPPVVFPLNRLETWTSAFAGWTNDTRVSLVWVSRLVGRKGPTYLYRHNRAMAQKALERLREGYLAPCGYCFGEGTGAYWTGNLQESVDAPCHVCESTGLCEPEYVRCGLAARTSDSDREALADYLRAFPYLRQYAPLDITDTPQ